MWETEEGAESNREEKGEYDDHDDQYVLLHCQVKGTWKMQNAWQHKQDVTFPKYHHFSLIINCLLVAFTKKVFVLKYCLIK